MAKARRKENSRET